LFIFAGLLMVNGAWLRLNKEDLPLKKPTKERLTKWITSGADIFFWLLLALLVGSAIVIKFYA
jgi:hypothetical protein